LNYHDAWRVSVQIETITISGFRSFGAMPVTIALAGDLTAVIGPNASGKTALLQALAKLFGVTRAQRTIHRSDFHLPPDVDPSDRTLKYSLARSMPIVVIRDFHWRRWQYLRQYIQRR
jgi:predicted ATP-dependent endonuclease of OLD family